MRKPLAVSGPCLRSETVRTVLAMVLSLSLCPCVLVGLQKRLSWCLLTGAVLSPPLSRLVGVVLSPPLWRLVLAVAMLRMRLVSTRCLPLRPRLPLSQGRSDGLFHLILMALLIVSINANGLRDLDKRSGFLRWLRSLPCTVDVVCVQEAHCTSAFECDS